MAQICEKFERLRAQCLKSGQLYEDLSFPAENKSIYFNKDDPSIVWRRPPEICSNPQFLVDGASKRDLCQGKLGNCWFLAATAILSTKPKLFRRVVPSNQDFVAKYAGVFRFNFWQYGEWVEVTVDDRLPTRNGQLIFCHNRDAPNEFWSALIEKAYAKLNGSYQAIEIGYSTDALVDFTGGIGEFLDLKDVKNKDKLFKNMKRVFTRNSFLCSAVEAQNGKFEERLANGLVTGHAYSITHVIEVEVKDGKIMLLRLRNPWGHREWNGAWSDGSTEWQKLSESERNTLDLKVEDDGEFWMSFEDWISNFHTLQICHLTPDTFEVGSGKHEWHVCSYSGAWIKGLTAGGSGAPPYEASTWDNPQYLVDLKEPDDDRKKVCLIVSLMQKFTRLKKSATKHTDTELPIGFDIYKYIGKDPLDVTRMQHLQHSSLHLSQKMFQYEYFRERTCRFSLEPGIYCVVPATYAVNQEGEFLLRLATEKPVKMGEVEEEIQSITEPTLKDAKERKFDLLFADCSGEDNVLDAKELKCLLNKGLKRDVDEEFSLATTRALIQAATGDKKSLLKKNECRKIWRRVKLYQESFVSFDADTSGKLNSTELEKAITAVGVKMGKKDIANIVKKFCSKTDQLTIDEFTLVAAKVAVTNESEIKFNVSTSVLSSFCLKVGITGQCLCLKNHQWNFRRSSTMASFEYPGGILVLRRDHNRCRTLTVIPSSRFNNHCTGFPIRDTPTETMMQRLKCSCVRIMSDEFVAGTFFLQQNKHDHFVNYLIVTRVDVCSSVNQMLLTLFSLEICQLTVDFAAGV